MKLWVWMGKIWVTPVYLLSCSVVSSPYTHFSSCSWLHFCFYWENWWNERSFNPKLNITASIKILRNNCNTHNLEMWRFNSEKYILWRFSNWYVNSWTKLFTLYFGCCSSFSQHDTNLDIFGRKGSQMENLPLSEYLMGVSMGYLFDF